jgi:hypothetical protein
VRDDKSRCACLADKSPRVALGKRLELSRRLARAAQTRQRERALTAVRRAAACPAASSTTAAARREREEVCGLQRGQHRALRKVPRRRARSGGGGGG